jgi:hypothetical protein
VQFVAIVERRLMHWFVYIPAFASSGSVPEPNDVQAFATALVTAATRLFPGDVQISLQVARTTDMLLPTSPTEVEVRHIDGIWRAAQHKGWLRQRDGSWKPLICYLAHGAVWERVVHASCYREATPDQPPQSSGGLRRVGPAAPAQRGGGVAPRRAPKAALRDRSEGA